MIPAYSLLILSIILILGRQGSAKLLDEGCLPRYIPMISGGGKYANPTPHMAYLRHNGEIKCGASLISNRFVLTAKYCVEYTGDYSVILGKYQKSKPQEEEQIQVASIVNHPDKYADIALLELKRDVEYKPNIKSICIIVDPAAESQLNALTEFTVLGQVRNVRKEAIVFRTDPSICAKSNNGNICVENPDQFTCKGDIGSPLTGYFMYNDQTVLAQLGVLAGGSNNECNRYTDVVKVTSWIATTIQEINGEEDIGIWAKTVKFFKGIFT